MPAVKEVSAVHASGLATRGAPEFTLQLTLFGEESQRGLVVACAETIRRAIRKLQPMFGLSSALDIGCDTGVLSKALAECGLNVCGLDDRPEKVAETRRRFPELLFETGDLQDRSVLELGQFDLVVCCSVLHRAENPLLATRHLRALTGKCLLLESVCAPGEEALLRLHDEPHPADGCRTELGWSPSEGAVAKMLYRAGFTAVYRVTPLPNHEDFRETSERARRRTLLLASTAPVDVAGFRLYPEPRESRDPWSKNAKARAGLSVRIGRFLAAPARRQYITLAMRARRIFPEMPIPLRLPFGAWWLAENGALDHELMYNRFEEREIRFVKRLLRPGMTVLDIGAHHGLYTLLASKRVGTRGRVIAFEPSLRECQRLAKHVRMNRCRNVSIETFALGDRAGEAEFFIVEGCRDWGNSLRPPVVHEPTRRARVAVGRLDDILAERAVERVDFIKLDAEGGEKAVLEGGRRLLQSGQRAVILAEVQDVRTRPWGYAAREIVRRLADWNFRWFSIGETGKLHTASTDDEEYDGNFVAIPEERVEEFRPLFAATESD